MRLHDNFGFLKKKDNVLYQHIHNAEKMVRINIDQSAGFYRKALEREMKRVLKEKGFVLSGESKKLFNMIEKVRELGLLPDIKMKQGVKVYGARSVKKFEDAYDFMRIVGNSGSHDEDSIKEKNGKIKLNYENMVIALKLFHEMMTKTYSVVQEEYFDESKMFIEDYAVYESERIPEWDKSGCVWQYRACKEDEEGDISSYAIIRQYDQKTFKPLLLRNKKLYSEAMKMSEKNMPDGLTQMEEITPYNNDNAFYLIAYIFYGNEPQKLSQVLSELDNQNRMELCKRIVKVFCEMHDYEEPIYHRLLNPDCVYVCKKGNHYIPYIVNFSYAKINSSDLTVKGKLKDAKEAKSYGIYCKYLAPEYERCNFEGAIENDTWKKIDIYALGVLLADIAIGKISPEIVQYDDLIDADVPEEVAELISLLHNEDPDDRVELDQVLEVI